MNHDDASWIIMVHHESSWCIMNTSFVWRAVLPQAHFSSRKVFLAVCTYYKLFVAFSSATGAFFPPKKEFLDFEPSWILTIRHPMAPKWSHPRLVSGTWGSSGDTLELARGGQQEGQEDKQRYHTPGDPKGSADLDMFLTICFETLGNNVQTIVWPFVLKPWEPFL